MNLSWRKPEPAPLPPILTEHEACQLVGFHDAMEAQNREEALALRDRLKLEIEAKQDALAKVEAWLDRIERPVRASEEAKPTKPKRRTGKALAAVEA